MTITRSTLATEGVRRGFYAGTSPALVAYVSENSVLFTALGQTQKLVARVRGKAFNFLIMGCWVVGLGDFSVSPRPLLVLGFGARPGLDNFCIYFILRKKED